MQPSAAAPGPAPARRETSLKVLSGVPFLMVLGNSMLFPVFPKMQASLGLSGVATGLLVTAFSVPAGLCIPWAGYLSDRWGRKRVMIPGVLAFGLGALVAGLAPLVLTAPFPALLVGRVVQGAGAAGMSQLAIALAADLFPGSARPRALGLIEAANGLGKVVSPVAGALVGLIAWYAPFYLFALLSGPLALGLAAWVREGGSGRGARAPRAYLHRIGSVLRRQGGLLAAAFLLGGGVLLALFGTLFFLSEVLEGRYGMGEVSAGLILAIPTAALSLGSYVVGLGLQKRRGLSRVAAVAGAGLMAAVMAAVALRPGLPLMAAAVSVVGMGGALALPSLNLIITSAVSAQSRGLITSLYGAVRFFGVALGPPAFALGMRWGTTPLFLSAAAFLAASAGVAGCILILGSRRSLDSEGGPGGAQQGNPTTGRYSPKRLRADGLRQGAPAATPRGLRPHRVAGRPAAGPAGSR